MEKDFLWDDSGGTASPSKQCIEGLDSSEKYAYLVSSSGGDPSDRNVWRTHNKTLASCIRCQAICKEEFLLLSISLLSNASVASCRKQALEAEQGRNTSQHNPFLEDSDCQTVALTGKRAGCFTFEWRGKHWLKSWNRHSYTRKSRKMTVKLPIFLNWKKTQTLCPSSYPWPRAKYSHQINNKEAMRGNNCISLGNASCFTSCIRLQHPFQYSSLQWVTVLAVLEVGVWYGQEL